MADQWALKINKMAITATLMATQDFIETCIEEECLVTLTCKNPILAPLEEFIHHNAVKIEKICRALNLAGLMTLDTCHFRK